MNGNYVVVKATGGAWAYYAGAGWTLDAKLAAGYGSYGAAALVAALAIAAGCGAGVHVQAV